MDILFTIVMPTYNSERTIERALKSIRMQTIPQEQIEILVIDGGSTDNTISISNKYGAIILNNERKLPEFAKQIGFRYVYETINRRQWLIMMDSDEEFTDIYQLENRKAILEKNPEVLCLMKDITVPGIRKECGIACSYISLFGDPFSYIVQKNTDSICRTFRSNRIENGFFEFKKGDITPIGDGGTTTVDAKKLVQIYGAFFVDQSFVNSVFQKCLDKNSGMLCIENDTIVHYTNGRFFSYMDKLKFRVKNNIFSKVESGFSNRVENNSRLSSRTILFLIYGLLVPIPILDSLRMCIKHKDISLLLHVVYLYYVIVLIIIYEIQKVFGIYKKTESYGIK